MINFFQNADGGLTFINESDSTVIMRLDTDGNIYMADTTLVFTNLDLGASGTAGSVDIFPATAARGKIAIIAANSAGDTTTTITNASQSGARTYTIPDAGASASFAMTEGAQTFNGVQTYTLPRVADHNTTISAFAGGGQASATALTGEFNNVTTVASNFDSVKLLTAVLGQVQTVRNSGAAILSVFPNTSDAINSLAVNLSIDIPVGGEVTFRAIDATTWMTVNTVTLNSPSTQAGTLVFRAADNAGNTQTVITNASQAGARTYTIPDAGASASFVMTEGAQTLNGVKTFGSAPLFPATGFQCDSVTMSQLKWVDVTVTAALLDSAGTVNVIAGVTGDQYKIRNVILVGGGTNFGAGGDRTISLTDGTTTWTTIANADIESVPSASLMWGNSKVPFLTGTSDTASASNAAIRFQYAGGTTDHSGTGSIKFAVLIEKVA